MTAKKDDDLPDSVMEALSQKQLRIVVLGNVDAGKSSLVGVLKTGKMDDGNGSSRSIVTKLKHELSSGRTSSAVSHMIGLTSSGDIVKQSTKKKYTEAELVRSAGHVLNLVDLPGHEAYLKTAIHGITKAVPDYAMILVNARQGGPNHMTARHLSICAGLGIPVVLVMTKIDGCPPDVVKECKAGVMRLLRSTPDLGTKAFELREEEDVAMVSSQMDLLTPLISISSVTGSGLVPLLTNLLVSLPKRRRHHQKVGRPFELMIEDIFQVPGVGTVVSGLVNAGEWKKGESVYVGPTSDGNYMKTNVRSAHIAQTDVDHVWAGHSACLALALTKDQKKHLRKSMVVLKQPVEPVREFVASVDVLKGTSMTVRPGTSAVAAHILNMRYTATIVQISDESSHRPVWRNFAEPILCPGIRATIEFDLKDRLAYLRPGMRIVIRVNNLTAVGVIQRVHCPTKRIGNIYI